MVLSHSHRSRTAHHPQPHAHNDLRAMQPTQCRSLQSIGRAREDLATNEAPPNDTPHPDSPNGQGRWDPISHKESHGLACHHLGPRSSTSSAHRRYHSLRVLLLSLYPSMYLPRVADTLSVPRVRHGLLEGDRGVSPGGGLEMGGGGGARRRRRKFGRFQFAIIDFSL